MSRRWPTRLLVVLFLALGGCAQPLPRREYVEVVEGLHQVAHRPPHTIHPDEPEALRLDPEPMPVEISGPQPVDAYIQRALAENQTVQAARFNVLALKARIPQVTSLDDPTVSNTIYPIPSVAPQYSLMGYNPYNLMIAQQFPWAGTLRLRGEAAEQDVQVAFAELAAAQLDAVSGVKRAYYDLYFSERAEAILVENRKFASDVVEFAKARLKSGGSQQDYLRADVVISDIDRELLRIRQGLTSARADLAQVLHVSPESDLRTTPEMKIAEVPKAVDRLYRLAVAARPELRGRLAAVARDERAVELARKRYYPNVTLGLSYMDMEKTNAMTPNTAGGMPNIGFFVGFNLPVYRAKLAAGVCEAQARTVADAKLYEAERDATYREVKDLLSQANTQRQTIEIFRTNILPKSEQALEAAASDYRLGNVDYVTLMTAWREVLQIKLQVAQVESELGKALASLERAVGVQLNEHPPTPEAESTPDAASDAKPMVRPVPPGADSSSPFPSQNDPAKDQGEDRAKGKEEKSTPPQRQPRTTDAGGRDQDKPHAEANGEVIESIPPIEIEVSGPTASND
ncbi:TolC family protein [Singulisphaera sp. PoT]|uniref:TolC family protein n=1 Tax=Singulisphaera sp. PoT TaxID=3411797 RepID=UPI003BF51B02